MARRNGWVQSDRLVNITLIIGLKPKDTTNPALAPSAPARARPGCFTSACGRCAWHGAAWTMGASVERARRLSVMPGPRVTAP